MILILASRLDEARESDSDTVFGVCSRCAGTHFTRGVAPWRPPICYRE
jgi:hypothetical protein